MVKKSLSLTAAVFALYAVWIGQFRPNWSVSQHQWQDNQIKGERFIYDSLRAEQVLVGSSLACRLGPLPGVYNLALGGQSLFDGLAIVTQQVRPVRVVYVETNIVDREEDAAFTETLNNPVLIAAKRQVKALRSDKQPLAFLAERVQRQLVQPLLNQLPGPAAAAGAGPGNLFDEMLQNQVKNNAQIPAGPLLEQQYAKLSALVKALEKRGTRVVFFEMPVDTHLCDSPKAVAIRTAFQRHFPANKYRYVRMPDCGSFQTTDGVHLNPESATRYTQYLFEHL